MKHVLAVVMASADPMGGSAKVVRWCTVCGAVVVDVDYDGRTNPGKMVYPLGLDEDAEKCEER